MCVLIEEIDGTLAFRYFCVVARHAIATVEQCVKGRAGCSALLGPACARLRVAAHRAASTVGSGGAGGDPGPLAATVFPGVKWVSRSYLAGHTRLCLLPTKGELFEAELGQVRCAPRAEA